MSELSPVQTDTFALLTEDLYVHLDEADSLCSRNIEWTDEDAERAREVISDLVLLIRGLLIEHRLQQQGECRVCASSWPCPVVSTIHSVVKDPHRQFVALVTRSHEDG